MKKFFSLFCMGLMALNASAIDVVVEEAGTLQYEIGNDYLTVKELKVTGPLNGTDMVTLRAMCGVNNKEEQTGSGALEVLDLSDAKMVAGGDAYFTNSAGPKVAEEDAIGVAAFRHCRTLKTLTLPTSVTGIRKYAFYGCTHLEHCYITDNVASINEYAFAQCMKLKELPNSALLTKYETGLFAGIELEEIVIPDNIEYIGWYTFEKASNLETVVLGKRCAQISTCSFQDVNTVADFTIQWQGWEGETGLVIGGDWKYVFDAWDATGTVVPVLEDADYEYITLHVPAEAVNAYKARSPWNKMNIVALGVSDGVEQIVNVDAKGVAARYSIDGKELAVPVKGVNIVRMNDGTTRKVIY